MVRRKAAKLFCFCRSLEDTALQTSLQLYCLVRLASSLSLRVPLLATFLVRVERQSPNSRLCRQSTHVVHSEAIFAFKALAKVLQRSKFSVAVKVVPKYNVPWRMLASTFRVQRNYEGSTHFSEAVKANVRNIAVLVNPSK